MTTTKMRSDSEFLSIIWMALLFGGVIICMDIWYSDWEGMANTWKHWAKIVAIILNVLMGITGVICFWEWRDPNYDKFRYAFHVICAICFFYIGGWRAAKNENTMEQQDIDKSKQVSHEMVIFSSHKVNILNERTKLY